MNKANVYNNLLNENTQANHFKRMRLLVNKNSEN